MKDLKRPRRSFPGQFLHFEHNWPRLPIDDLVATAIDWDADSELETDDADTVPPTVHVTVVASRVVLPDGRGGFGPCPELLTEEEAMRYLRLDYKSAEQGRRTLRYYREQGVLRATPVGNRVRYRRSELDVFLKKQTEKHNA